MRGHFCLPCPQTMTEGFFDISRSLCYLPDFSYKANTFIFYAKVIQRIYIKAGEGWLSKELPVQLLPHGSPAGPFFFSRGSQRRAKGHSSLGCAHPSWSAQLAGPWA